MKPGENKELSCLLWADDILILSGLQRKLNTLGIYCTNNKLSVNTGKTECMIFHKTGRLIEDKYLFNSTTIKNVRKYKYLGFLVTPSGEIKSGLEDLRIRSLKALMKMRSTLGPLFQQNMQNSIHLYNHMIKPILLYASDFWGCLKLPKNNQIERLHNMFCKLLLGVQKQTNTVGILLELGMVPITYNAIKASVKNWDRIKNKKSNNLLNESFTNALKENLPWTSGIETILKSNGMVQSFIANNVNKSEHYKKKPTCNLIFERLCDQFHQNTFEAIRGENSKLKTYSVLKIEIGLETYLTDIKNIKHRCAMNVKHRCAMAKLRLSNHPLLIETGRHSKIERQLRFCPFCPTIIEDEIHFLFQCPNYKDMRENLLTKHLLMGRLRIFKHSTLS